MSFIADLFGSSTPAAAPAPVQATPTINDAASHSAAVEENARMSQRAGTDKSILTTGLGDSSAGSKDVQRTSALGGNTSLTQST